MNYKIVITIFLLASFSILYSQSESEINKTDQQGRKQGHWIKKYPNESVMYDGHFKDNYPVGEFKRFGEKNNLESILIYSNNGKEADAVFYHPNGFVSSKGKYVNQKKEGKWQFFSSYINGYLISEDHYSANLRNGISMKFYPDSTIAEKMEYLNDLRHGECLQYYPNGSLCLKAKYLAGMRNGKFEVWFENGQLEFSGQYKNDARDGTWFIFNSDGTVRYKMEYAEGITNDRQMEIEESDYLDLLEKNRGKIADPEKTGIIN